MARIFSCWEMLQSALDYLEHSTPDWIPDEMTDEEMLWVGGYSLATPANF